MKTLFLTNEYPPNIYGGAGVHVEYLSRALAQFMAVEVRCFGNQNLSDGTLSVRGFSVDSSSFECPKPLYSVFGALSRCLDFNTSGVDADVVHCHTWYSHFGGILAKLNYGVPLIITVHSLEPLRPWKREQLGHGYDFSSWVEKTALEMADAVIAVSEETKRDVVHLFKVPNERIHVIYNGIDLEEYRLVSETDILISHGVDPDQPYVLFVGRIARQKGIIYLVNAIRHLIPGFQVVLCASSPDTPTIESEVSAAIKRVQTVRPGVIWIREMLDVHAKVQLYSHASVFVCPSIYEPFGIINLEAMACNTAVVAAAVGGIREVVVHGETGFLIPLKQRQESPFDPLDPEQFEQDLAARINDLMVDGNLSREMGAAGRRRAEKIFGWDAIAKKTRDLYETVTHVR